MIISIHVEKKVLNQSCLLTSENKPFLERIPLSTDICGKVPLQVVILTNVSDFVLC